MSRRRRRRLHCWEKIVFSFFNREFSREREPRATAEKEGEQHHCYSCGGAIALYVEEGDDDDDDDEEEEDSIARRRLSFFNGGFSIERESKAPQKRQNITITALVVEQWLSMLKKKRKRKTPLLHQNSSDANSGTTKNNNTLVSNFSLPLPDSQLCWFWIPIDLT